ncbi:MAG: hypothetical protein QGE97_05990 [SAR324 cluster bacterium]|jgi:hypothetical protein|nr:hypothetical protein [SAR324 cluster bacterium]MDP6638783.1 hypothetical protein [SAR324 cluster bacterium]MDP7500923.1 hypothetical protein [SAR324 cluster bacterium]|tara:strand:- start:140 stop:1354 length:1215 start_codon:yes stop_codon:yes gene_type:complete
MMHLLPSSMGLQTIYRIRPVVLVVMWFLFVTSVLQAGGELRRPFQGIRNLGMGNVGVAMSHDENALFYNPAGLAAVDTTIVSIPFVNEVSKDTLSLTSQVAKLGSDSTTADTVALALGKQIHYRNMTALNVIIPFGSLMTFGAAAGLETTIDLSASNPVGIQFNYGMRLDQIYNIGGGFNLGRGRWLIGVNVEKYKRCDYPVKTVAMSTLLNSSNIASDVGFCKTDLMRDGQTYGFGFQNRMSSFSTLRMVWGMSVRNLGGLKFARKDNETNPLDQKAEYNIGIAMTPFDSMLFRNFYEIDIRDLTFDHSDDAYCTANKNSSDCNMKRIHIGTEFGFWPIDSGASALALRLGWNQGYVSQGLEINPLIFFRGLSIQYADYKVETGNSAGDKPERRRTLQVNLGF